MNEKDERDRRLDQYLSYIQRTALTAQAAAGITLLIIGETLPGTALLASGGATGAAEAVRRTVKKRTKKRIRERQRKLENRIME